MRILARTALILAATSIVGCGRSTPLQPDPVNRERAISNPAQASSQSVNATATSAASGKPEIDPTYANGTTVYMKLNNHTSRTTKKVFDQFSLSRRHNACRY